MSDSEIDVHPVVRQRDCWNKCDVCGRFIPFTDLKSGRAIHNMKTPDSDVSYESWETLCKNHSKANKELSGLSARTGC